MSSSPSAERPPPVTGRRPPSTSSGDLDDDEEDDGDDDVSFSDDEVVAEYPVFLHQELTPHLYLVCSPFRPYSRPYSSDVGPLHAVRVKPQQKRVEVEYSLYREDASPSSSTASSPSSFNFDANAAHPLSHLTLAGRPVPAKTNYTIGRFDGRALHLTPLHATVRLKPDLTHLDVQAAEELALMEATRREEEREREREAGEWSMEEERKDLEEEEEAAAASVNKAKEMRPLTVRFKKKESEKSASYRTASHAYIKQMEEKEQWVQLQSYEKDSEEAAHERASLTALPSPIPTPKVDTLDVNAYLSYLNPHSTAAHLSSASYADRILTLLRSARALPFHLILQKLGISSTSSVPSIVALRDELAHYCDRFAYYIQHSFVVKSILVFDTHLSAMSMGEHQMGGVAVKTERDREREREREREMKERERRSPSRDEMCRDYLLCQFYSSPVVHRDRVCTVMRLDVEATEARLSEVSEKREGITRGGWQWRWREDEAETRLVQSLPAFHHLLKQQEKIIKEMETRAKWALESQHSSSSTSATSPVFPFSSSPSSSSPFIVNSNQPTPVLPSSSSSSTASAHTAAFALLTHLFREHGVCSENYLLSQFQQAASTPSIPPSPLSSLTVEGFRSLISSFSLPITSSLFIRKTLSNPAVDRYRSVIASLFAVRSRIKKGDVHRAIEDCYGDEIPDNLYRKVMKEFATFDKGIWQLKSGDY